MRPRLNGFFLFLVLVSCSSAFAAGEIREIHIKAAVSPAFKADSGWEQDIRDRILFANKIFEPVFHVHFSLKNYIEWQPQDETRPMDLLMEELRSFIPLEADEVIIGFHKMKQAFTRDAVSDMDTVGSAQFFRGFVVIRDPFSGLDEIHRDVVLAHELGHLFGAVHVSDETAIMHPSVPLNPSLIFDDDNRDIIGTTHGVDFKKGIDSISGESLDRLIRIYERLIRNNPLSDFYHQLGLFYQKRNQPAKAISVWEEAVRYHYDNPYIHRELGYFYYQSGRYDRTIQELGSAVAHFILPSQKAQRAMAFNFLGVAYYQKQNLDQAIFNWLQGLSADPDNALLQENLAVAYMQSGDLGRGISELEKLAVKNPNDATILSNLGVAHIANKEYQKAIEYLKLALVKLSTNPTKNSETENSSALMGEVTEAAIDLNLGAAYLELHQTEEAIKVLEKSRSLEPKNFEVHRNLARSYVETHNHEAAVKEIEEALRYKKDDPYLYAFLGQIHAEKDEKDQAMQAFRDGLRYAQGDLAASLHKYIGVLYARDRNFSSALAEIKSSLNQNWKDPDAHMQMGLIYANTGDFQEAKRSFENVLRFDSQHEGAKKALESLPKK